tara:strand:+ start:250 stop:666 length:417 start_codon:yes stop_codon:yes gene_type:complete
MQQRFEEVASFPWMDAARLADWVQMMGDAFEESYSAAFEQKHIDSLMRGVTYGPTNEDNAVARNGSYNTDIGNAPRQTTDARGVPILKAGGGGEFLRAQQVWDQMNPIEKAQNYRNDFEYFWKSGDWRFIDYDHSLSI